MVHVNQQALICFWGSTWTVLSYCLKNYRFVTTSSNIILAVHRWWAHIKLRYWLIWHDFWPLAIWIQSPVHGPVQSPGFVLSPIDITQDFPLSSELQGRDIGMVSYDAILYASLETRVAKYYNNWSCCRGWEIYLVHRLFLSTLVYLTRIIVREQCIALIWRIGELPALVAWSVVLIATPCALHVLPIGGCLKGLFWYVHIIP